MVIEWSMWANEHAIVTSAVMFIGGVLGVAGKFEKWQLAACVIPLSLIIFLMEYPRGKKRTGKMRARQYQQYFSHFFIKFGIPCCFLLPTLFGGLSLFYSSILYLIAAFKGEIWEPIYDNLRENNSEITVILPPNRPPPRPNNDDLQLRHIYENVPRT